jgi:hypothetical protein
MSDHYGDERIGVKPDSDAPEWWAMDREYFCDYCGHSAYRHRERLGDSDLAPCGECACADFQSEEADQP